MKNTKKYSLILLCLIIASLLGCKKKLFDYRTKYLGNYQFTTYSFTSWSSGDSIIHTMDTTYITKGKITYGPHRDEILIYTDGSGGGSVTWVLYKDGSLSTQGCQGEFLNKNKIRISCQSSGALGSWGGATIIGEKK